MTALMDEERAANAPPGPMHGETTVTHVMTGREL